VTHAPCAKPSSIRETSSGSVLSIAAALTAVVFTRFRKALTGASVVASARIGERMPKVLMSFHYKSGWEVVFFDSDRRRTLLPRKAFFNSDEALVEFVRRGNGVKTLEDKNIFEMMMQRNSGEITLNLTPEQYAKLR
jgi:hypothetical protein